MLVDPLDGTANFVDGSPDWAVMVALVENGTTLACWIWQPVRQLMYIAEFRNGAVPNGEPLPGEGSSRRPSEMRGAVLTRFLDQGTAALIAANTHRFAITPMLRPGTKKPWPSPAGLAIATTKEPGSPTSAPWHLTLGTTPRLRPGTGMH